VAERVVDVLEAVEVEDQQRAVGAIALGVARVPVARASVKPRRLRSPISASWARWRPCGMCRELISDFGLDAWVIIPSVDGPPRKVAVLDLLPEKYTRVDASS
jgi:hypothetical protein